MEDNVIFEYSSIIGKFKFRFINCKDYDFIKKTIFEKEKNEIITRKILYNQLYNQIDSEQFNKIKLDELQEIILQFLEKEEIFDIIKIDENYDNIFDKFIELLKKYVKNKEILHNSISKVFSGYINQSKNFTNIINSILKPTNQLTTTLNHISKINNSFQINNNIIQQISGFNSRYNNLFQSINNLLSSKNKLWQNLGENYQKNHKIAIKKLKKYSWFINDSMPASFILKVSKVKNTKEIKKIFLDYHINNNYQVLDKYLVEWGNNLLFKKRMKIIRDAINLFKENEKNKCININNIIIPVLINQIEGLKHDYMLKMGFNKLPRNQYNDSNGQCVGWESAYVDAIQNQNELMKLTFEVFRSILFQKEEKPAKIIKFSRHNIAHGSTRYGSTETTIRCFMILEFINKLP